MFEDSFRIFYRDSYRNSFKNFLINCFSGFFSKFYRYSKICSGNSLRIFQEMQLKIPTCMCTEISSETHPENPTRIPPEILALLLSVIQTGIPLELPSGVHTKALSGFPLFITSEIYSEFRFRIIPIFSPWIFFLKKIFKKNYVV